MAMQSSCFAIAITNMSTDALQACVMKKAFTVFPQRFKDLKHLHFKNQTWGSKVPRTSFISDVISMLLDIVFVEKVLLVCVCLRLYGL
jgi:hypothetical protein